MNKERRVLIVGCDLGSGKSVGSLVEAIMSAEKEIQVVVCTDPVPVPQKQDPVEHRLIDPETLDFNFYQPKARRQRKQWQRPYKYHQ